MDTLDANGVGMFADAAHALDHAVPNPVFGEAGLQLPEVFAIDQQDVVGAEIGSEIDGALAQVNRELAGGAVGVEEAEQNQGHGADGQANFFGNSDAILDLAIRHLAIVGINVDGVVADVLDDANAIGVRVDGRA